VNVISWASHLFAFKRVNLCRRYAEDVAQNQEVFNQGKHYGGAVQVESS
jgi:hypothetical protein